MLSAQTTMIQTTNGEFLKILILGFELRFFLNFHLFEVFVDFKLDFFLVFELNF
jgi:hypothetical protein